MRHCVVFNANQEIKRRTSGAYRFANQLEGLGWRVTVVDWVDDWPQHKLVEYLDAIVTVETVMFAWSYTWMKPWWAGYAIGEIKKRYPGRKHIAGGQQFFQHHLGLDAMLYGYAEVAVPHVLNWLFDGGPKPKGKDILGGLFVDCNTDYTAMDLGDYGIDYRDDDYILDHELLTVELSRGCKFRCKYCNYAFLGVKQDTSTEAELLYNELLDNYERFGTTNYILADDTLNDRESKLEMLGDVVQKLPFEPNFACFIRLDLTVAKPQQLKLLSRARVWNHFYGVETLNDAAGKAVAKGMPSKRIKQGMMDIRKHFMDELGLYRGSLGMIAGLPHETPESWWESEIWLREHWSDQNWQWWPLEISLDENTATTSVFSKEWKLHGYRQITDSKRIDEINKKYDRTHGGVQHKFDDHSLFWTADWADIGEATDFVWEVNHGEHHNLIKKLPSFHMLNHFPFHTPEEALDLTVRYDDDTNAGSEHQHKTIIQPYINAKLKGVENLTQLIKSGAGPGILASATQSLHKNRTLRNEKLWNKLTCDLCR